jgi:DNA repair exonuclease SbcCD ATPase subunit
MCKKLWVGALAVGVGLLLVGTPLAGWLWSNAKVCCSRMGQEIDDNTPIDWEIQRLEAQLPQLDGEIQKHKRTIVKEEVALDNLREQIAADEKGLAAKKRELDDLVRLVDTSEDYVVVNNTRMKTSTAKQKLASTLDTCKTLEKALESKKRTLEARERAVMAARDRLEAMKARQTQLKNDLEQLKAEYAELQAQKAAQLVPTDDSRTAKLAQDVQKLKDRVKVESKLAAEDGSGFTPETEDGEDPVKAAKDYLGQEPKTVNK